MSKPGSIREPRAGVPIFSLYGESQAPSTQGDGVHIESIQSRSRKYLWKIGTHRHALLSQCVLVAAGPVTAVLDDVRTVLAGPAAMIVPAGTVHSFRFRSDSEGHVLTVDLARLLSMATAVHQLPIESLFAMPRAVDLKEQAPLARRVEQLLDRLQQEFLQPDSSAAPIGTWLACSVLWMLAAGTSTHAATAAHAAPGMRGHQDAERLRRFRLLIERQYPEHWPVERYARHLALSETSLNRLCRAMTGTTAFELIQLRLALEARRRLIYSLNSVSRVAAELGFQDPAYFSRFFRRRNGLSPNEYRRRHHGG